MLKKSAGSLLASFRLSTLSRIFSEARSTERLIARAKGPHEVRSVHYRAFTRCGFSGYLFEQPVTGIG